MKKSLPEFGPPRWVMRVIVVLTCPVQDATISDLHSETHHCRELPLK
ncbi:hypothetical protein HMPREF0880_02961 [Yokenella regensburgei ATCC 43003]|nr:hypothetical protein HMPREF0880_02961 [Yokenella regensburgei ATCC 43003]